MNKPKVSILLPAYNHEKYLEATIESVLNQTVADFELLISDDCSKDNSSEIIKKYNDIRISSVFFEKNRGTVRALNYLLERANGEYIAVIGSDDMWEPDKLEKQLNVLESDASIVACFSNVTLIDEKSKKIVDDIEFPKDIFEVKNSDRVMMLKKFFFEGNCLCHSSALIRRDVHQKIGIYNVAYRQLHDFDLWVRILLHYQICVIEEPLVQYRIVRDSGNVSQNTEKNTLRLLNEAENILLYLLENISDDDFEHAFGKKITASCIRENDRIICEKILLLEENKLWGLDNTSLLIKFIMKHLNESVLNCLETECGISLNNVYEYTANYNATCFPESYFEMKDLRRKQQMLKYQLKQICTTLKLRIIRNRRNERKKNGR